jgi:hypothetical protein
MLFFAAIIVSEPNIAGNWQVRRNPREKPSKLRLDESISQMKMGVPVIHLCISYRLLLVRRATDDYRHVDVSMLSII